MKKFKEMTSAEKIHFMQTGRRELPSASDVLVHLLIAAGCIFVVFLFMLSL